MKRNVWRVLLSSIAISLLLLVSACGTSQTSSDKSSSSGGTQEQKKKLRVVTDASYAPMESLDGDKIVGFDADILEAIMKEAGYKYELVNVGWDPLFVEIQGKTADMAISSITINDKRKKTYDFSIPYFKSTNKILLKQNSSIENGNDLKGKTIAVQNGTTGQEIVEGILGKDPEHVKKFESNVLAIMELLKGGADAVVADNAVVEEYAKNNPNENLKVVTDPSFPSEFYGLMFPKGSKLKADMDKALKKLIENGTYTEIYKKTFGTDPDIDTLKKQY